MADSRSVVFLFDVDNTLLDNDRVVRDLAAHLERRFGSERKDRYFAVFEELRSQVGYADYLGALQRYRAEYPTDHRLLQLSAFLVEYPFANRLYPNSLDVIEHCGQWGPTVILSDGDVVFQPRKIERSAIWDTPSRVKGGRTRRRRFLGRDGAGRRWSAAESARVKYRVHDTGH